MDLEIGDEIRESIVECERLGNAHLSLHVTGGQADRHADRQIDRQTHRQDFQSLTIPHNMANTWRKEKEGVGERGRERRREGTSLREGL